MPSGKGSAVALPGSRQTLSKEQKQFNKLIADIENARAALAHWREFIEVTQRQHTARMAPLLVEYRELRIAMVTLLDAEANGKRLTRGERRKVVDLLQTTLSGLLDEARTPELERLYEKYNGASFEADSEAELDFMRDLMRETMGIEVGDEARTPESFAHALHESIRTEEAEHERKQREKPKRKQSAKAREREAKRAEAEKGATQSVREVYRKLVAELHPDREPDPAERARKTGLMQQANQAYKSGDLLTLLTLQLKIEQINPADLAGIARERLLRYNRVLAEQLRQLRNELTGVIMPFEDFRSVGALRETDLHNGMDAEHAQMESVIRATEADLVAFRDVAVLKRTLKSYRVGQAMAEELEDMEALLFDEMLRSGTRR